MRIAPALLDWKSFASVWKPAATVLLILSSGCSDNIGWPSPTEKAISAAIQSDSVTAAPAAAYLACVEEHSLATPNGRETMDLSRIYAVLTACTAQESSATAAFAQRFAADEDRHIEIESRTRVLRADAVALIRRTPFQPTLTATEIPPTNDIGLRTRIIETAPLPLR